MATALNQPVSVFPIETERDYDRTIAEIKNIWGAPANTPEGRRLDVLMDLVEIYEQKHHAIEPPDPILAIKARMKDLDMNRDALGDILGVSSGRVSEVLNRKRKLNLKMIRKLEAALGLSYTCLCQEYQDQ